MNGVRVFGWHVGFVRGATIAGKSYRLRGIDGPKMIWCFAEYRIGIRCILRLTNKPRRDKLTENVAYLQGKKDKPKTALPEQIVFHSSFLSSATYDASTYTLTVEFKSGEPFVYHFVFPAVWSEFKDHPSPGKYWNQAFRGGKYPSFDLKPGLKVSAITSAKKKYRHGVKL